MTEKMYTPNTDPIDAVNRARELFETRLRKQRDGDIELTDRGDRFHYYDYAGRNHYIDAGGEVRLFKPGTKTVVDTILSATPKDRIKLDSTTRSFDVTTNISGESGIMQRYDTRYREGNTVHYSDAYYNVWDTVPPSYTVVPYERASTTVVKCEGKREVFRQTYKNPEIAKKIASIASKRIISRVEGK